MCNIRRFYSLRELYEADFHKPGIYGSGRNGLTRGTCFVARRLEVLAVAGLLSISWGVLGAAGFRVPDRWLRETQSNQRRLGEGATTSSQSAHLELASTDPHQVYPLLCSHLRIMASVDQ